MAPDRDPRIGFGELAELHSDVAFAPARTVSESTARPCVLEFWALVAEGGNRPGGTAHSVESDASGPTCWRRPNGFAGGHAIAFRRPLTAASLASAATPA